MLLLAWLAMTVIDADKAGPMPIGDVGSWFSSDDYPPSALRAHEEGAVVFTLDVSDKGAVTACRIKTSSGFADLDAQTCASATRNARFSPALDKRGRPIASVYTRRTRWVIPESSPWDDWMDGPLGSNMSMASAQADVRVDVTGKVTSCEIKRVTGAAIDPCQPFPVDKAVTLPAVVNGTPIPASLRAFTILSAQPDTPSGFDWMSGLFAGNIGMASALAEFEVDAAGKVTSCVVKRVTSVAIDPCQQLPIGKVVTTPVVIDGTPTAARFRSFTLVNTQSKPVTNATSATPPTPRNP